MYPYFVGSGIPSVPGNADWECRRNLSPPFHPLKFHCRFHFDWVGISWLWLDTLETGGNVGGWEEEVGTRDCVGPGDQGSRGPGTGTGTGTGEGGACLVAGLGRTATFCVRRSLGKRADALSVGLGRTAFCVPR